MSSGSSSFRRRYFLSIGILAVLSTINISVKSNVSNDETLGLLLDFKVTAVTLLLASLFWLPVLLPWFLEQLPQIKSSLRWIKEQGIEEIETNLIRIKLASGTQEAARQYEQEILDAKSKNKKEPSFDTLRTLETQYKNSISLVSSAGQIDSAEAIERTEKLADYYDRIRQEMPSSARRTRLMTEISSIMWTLVPKIKNFPVNQRLNSHMAGERLSAYKYLEWQPSTRHSRLLVSRSIGMLETPFGQYAALLALRRLAAVGELTIEVKKEISDILSWAATVDYIRGKDRHSLMIDIIRILKTSS